MEIIFTNWVDEKYPDAIKELIKLLERSMGNKGFAITRATDSYTRIIRDCKKIMTKSTLAYNVEIHVNLSEIAKDQTLDVDIPLSDFRKECGKFVQEAKALRKIAEMKRPFGLKVVCVSYLPPTQ